MKLSFSLPAEDAIHEKSNVETVQWTEATLIAISKSQEVFLSDS